MGFGAGRVGRDAFGEPESFGGIVLDITDRVEAERDRHALTLVVAQQARIFDTTLSSIVDFAYVFDRGGRFVDVNQALLDLWGITLADAVGKNFFDLGYPIELAAKLQRQIHQVLDTGEVVRDETPYVSPSGALGYYEYIFTPVRKEDQTIEVVAGSTRDITARRAAEVEREHLLARERFLVQLDAALRVLVDPEAIGASAAVLLGQQLGANWCAYAAVDQNQETFRIIGTYTDDGHDIIVDRTCEPCVVECLRAMRAGSPPVADDTTTDTGAGAPVSVAYSTSDPRAMIWAPVLKAGRIVGVLAVGVTVPRAWASRDRQLVEQVASRCWDSLERALGRADAGLQKRLLYSLYMQAPTLMAVLQGPDHVVALANPGVCDVWGRSAEELHDRPLFDVLPELRGQVFHRLLQNAFKTGEPYAGTETPSQFNRAGRGTETVYFNFVYSPYRTVHGDIEGIFVVASDVTEQVRARLQVNELREAAEAANRAKDAFLAMLAHELRNPLSAILGALGLMNVRGGPDSPREHAVIEWQVKHLTRLVDDILDVSRIASGKVELRKMLLEMFDIVGRAVEVTGPLLGKRGHELVVDVPRQGLMVEGDPTRLTQVVANLLTNAAKYTNPGGRIRVAARQDGAEVVLSVEDSGIGISPEALPFIFDLFVQERSASQSAPGGLGLGLPIVKSLVERHGGTVSVASAGADGGTLFTIRMPAAIEDAPGLMAEGFDRIESS